MVTDILAKIGDAARFTNTRSVQKLIGFAFVEGSSRKYEGKTVVSKWGITLGYHPYQAALVLIP